MLGYRGHPSRNPLPIYWVIQCTLQLQFVTIITFVITLHLYTSIL